MLSFVLSPLSFAPAPKATEKEVEDLFQALTALPDQSQGHHDLLGATINSPPGPEGYPLYVNGPEGGEKRKFQATTSPLWDSGVVYNSAPYY